MGKKYDPKTEQENTSKNIRQQKPHSQWPSSTFFECVFVRKTEKSTENLQPAS